ncbi:transposase domain-containing protein [Enterococcus cecorum]|uniref:transposase domain-containing protein n=1 Tax=Enterococcus cecorum TaxID=44008 RepID=UPI00200B0837|nr:transposase domain-containing protein [Enterococcus cecorum]
MTAEVNGLSPWKYLEWLLSEIKELETPTEEDFARYLPWSEKAQEKCKIGSICTEKISTLFQKRSLNAIQFEKIIAYQAIWRTPTILSNAYDYKNNHRYKKILKVLYS